MGASGLSTNAIWHRHEGACCRNPKSVVYPGRYKPRPGGQCGAKKVQIFHKRAATCEPSGHTSTRTPRCDEAQLGGWKASVRNSLRCSPPRPCRRQSRALRLFCHSVAMSIEGASAAERRGVCMASAVGGSALVSWVAEVAVGVKSSPSRVPPAQLVNTSASGLVCCVGSRAVFQRR